MPLTVFLTREQTDALRSDAHVVARGLCEVGGGPIEGQTESLAHLEERVKKARSFSELAWWVKQMTRSYAFLYADRVRFLQTGSSRARSVHDAVGQEDTSDPGTTRPPATTGEPRIGQEEDALWEEEDIDLPEAEGPDFDD